GRLFVDDASVWPLRKTRYYLGTVPAIQAPDQIATVGDKNSVHMAHWQIWGMYKRTTNPMVGKAEQIHVCRVQEILRLHRVNSVCQLGSGIRIMVPVAWTRARAPNISQMHYHQKRQFLITDSSALVSDSVPISNILGSTHKKAEKADYFSNIQLIMDQAALNSLLDPALKDQLELHRRLKDEIKFRKISHFKSKKQRSVIVSHSAM
ncbi:uncharacterized protein F5147DRAFT_660581, partial [Suillus discolor]